MSLKFWGKRRAKSTSSTSGHSRRVSLEPLEQRQLLALTATGIDPSNMGKGDWIADVFDAATNISSTSSYAKFAQTLKNLGFRWLVVKAGDGDNGPLFDYGDGKSAPVLGFWTQFNRELIDNLHAQGIKVFGYHHMYGGGDVSNSDEGTNSVPALEQKVALDILSLGADGLVVDAGSELENVTNNSTIAENYLKDVRSKYPNTFLALSSFAYISLHPKFPYESFSKYVDVNMPQDYWVTLDNANNSPDKMVADMDKEWKTLYDGFTTKGHPEWRRPIVPTGQGSDNVTGTVAERTTTSMIDRWYAALKNDAAPTSPGGYNGTSFFALELHNPGIWKGIVNNDIGNPGGIVTGRVYNDFDGDGFQTKTAEPGALGWTVYADDNNNGVLDSNEVRTTTDTNGDFHLFWLPAGDHTIRQQPPSSKYRITTADSFNVTVLENETSLSGSFGVTTNALIKGSIYTDVNLNATKDAKDKPLKGVVVWLDSDHDGNLDKGEKSTRTNKSGNYTFTVGLGNYQIRHLPLTGFRMLTPNRGYRKLDVTTRGATYAGNNFGDTNLVLIKGDVYVDSNSNNVKDSGEGAATTVYLDLNHNNVLDGSDISASTNENGTYSFNVNAGTYTVRSNLSSTIVKPVTGSYTLVLASGATATRKDFRYR